MSKNYHLGHRTRMRQRFLSGGIDSLNKHELLELLLYYCIPQRDTNEIAHRLLDKFNGSIAAVFDAEIEDLMEVEYIGYNAATLLKLIPAMEHIYVNDRLIVTDRIISTDSAKKFFTSKFYGMEEETFMAAFLDNNGGVLGCEIIGKGVVNKCEVNMRMAAQLAISKKASACIVAHNHPHALPKPSLEDIKSTHAIARMFDDINVRLVDHIIVGEQGNALSLFCENGGVDGLSQSNNNTF